MIVHWAVAIFFVLGVSHNGAHLKIENGRCLSNPNMQVAAFNVHVLKSVSTYTTLGVLYMSVVSDTNAHVHAHVRETADC